MSGQKVPMGTSRGRNVEECIPPHFYDIYYGDTSLKSWQGHLATKKHIFYLFLLLTAYTYVYLKLTVYLFIHVGLM